VDGQLNFSNAEVPDHLPRLDRGAHHRDDGRACAMEAAAWLAGEPWSDHPKSVHQVIGWVARSVNDRVPDDVRQTLWPLVLASLDTAQPWHPMLSMRLSRRAGKAYAAATHQGDLRKVWTTVLDEHARLYGERSSPVPASRLQNLVDHLKH